MNILSCFTNCGGPFLLAFCRIVFCSFFCSILISVNLQGTDLGLAIAVEVEPGLCNMLNKSSQSSISQAMDVSNIPNYVPSKRARNIRIVNSPSIDKFEMLKQGHAVEVRPGLSARLDLKNKTMQYSNGRVIDVSDNPNYFPKNQEENLQAKARQSVQKNTHGTLGQFIHIFKTAGLVGEIREWYYHGIQSPDEYRRRVQAERDESIYISGEYTLISAAAGIGSYLLPPLFLLLLISMLIRGRKKMKFKN